MVYQGLAAVLLICADWSIPVYSILIYFILLVNSIGPQLLFNYINTSYAVPDKTDKKN